MANEISREKSFSGRHWLGWTSAIILAVFWKITFGIYETFRASFEASIATAQLNDSIVQYSLIQKMMYGNLFPFLIHLLFLVLVILCLLPTIRDLFNENL